MGWIHSRLSQTRAQFYIYVYIYIYITSSITLWCIPVFIYDYHWFSIVHCLLILPSGKLTKLWKMATYSWFFRWKWWCSIVICVYQRVNPRNSHKIIKSPLPIEKTQFFKRTCLACQSVCVYDFSPVIQNHYGRWLMANV